MTYLLEGTCSGSHPLSDSYVESRRRGFFLVGDGIVGGSDGTRFASSLGLGAGVVPGVASSSDISGIYQISSFRQERRENIFSIDIE